MQKYIWLGVVAAFILTGCGETKEEKLDRKAKEFWEMKLDNSGDRAKREKLYDKCFDETVPSLREINEKAKIISGKNNGSKEFMAALKPLENERDAALAKCNEIRYGN